MEKKAGLILGGILLFSLVLVGVVMAVATPEEVSAGASVTVNEFLDITISGVTPIAFSSVNPGTSDNPAGGAVTITIQSTTNVVTDTFLKGADWSSPVALAINNVKYDDDNQLGECLSLTPEGACTVVASCEWVSSVCQEKLDSTTMSTAYGAADTGYFEDVPCPCGGSAAVKSISFWLSIPAGQQAGTYTPTTIFFKTVSNGETP